MAKSHLSAFLFTVFCFYLSQCEHVDDKDFYDIGSSSSNYDFVLDNGKTRWKRDEENVKNKKIQVTKKPTQLDKLKPSSIGGGKLSQLSTRPIGSELNATNYGANNNSEFNTPETSSFDDTLNPFENVTVPANVTSKEDHHIYYNSTIYYLPEEAMKFWVDIDKMPNVTLHAMLSKSHRRAAPVNLSFEFPFYGHPIKNVTIATGGFLYLGNTVHSWLAATQYVAPLMANFDTRIEPSSSIKYAENGTAFVVQWENVKLKDKTPDGIFSFQAILLKNGDIVFVYKDIPLPLSQVPDANHPVKVGLSDAYVIDKTAFFIRKKTIYEYHRAELKKENISNNTAIYLTALPTCLSLKDCQSCLVGVNNFECKWCESAGRCSDGLDRHRQEWLGKDCEAEVKRTNCSVSSNSSITVQNATGTISPYPGKSRKQEVPSVHSPIYHDGVNGHGKAGSGKVGFVAMMTIVSLISGIVLWLLYAYKNPQSSSGQFLIKYRPGQWHFSASEARYTAASIHM